MPISNLSSGSRPGVCTSTTRPTAPFEGQMIYETDTNRVLVWDNAAWVMIADTDQPPGLQLIKTHTITSGTNTQTVLDVFSSEYDVYKVVLADGDVTDAGDPGIYLWFENTKGTTAYYGRQEYTKFDGTANAFNGTANQGFFWTGLGGSGDNTQMTIDIFSPFSSTKPTTVWGTYTSNNYTGWFGGRINNTTSHSRFNLELGSGTWNSGTIRVYGYRN